MHQRIRPLPLLKEEVLDYRKKDSLEQLRKDPKYLDSLDRISNKVKINECAAYLKARINIDPKIAVVLGTGLGRLVDEATDQQIFPYAELPYFPQSTVVGHKGQLVFGKLKGKDVVMLQGRFHFYEGYSMKEVVFPIYVLKALGVETLILTNACGGVNEHYQPGDIVLIQDFINMVWINRMILWSYAPVLHWWLIKTAGRLNMRKIHASSCRLHRLPNS